MIRWENTATRLLWRTLLEDWNNLQAIALLVNDPADLAVRIRKSFDGTFARFPCPFLRYICRRSLRDVNFRQIADIYQG